MSESEAYTTARKALEDFFSDWGHDREETFPDSEGDEWSSHVVMKVFYIRHKDGKVTTKEPEE